MSDDKRSGERDGERGADKRDGGRGPSEKRTFAPRSDRPQGKPQSAKPPYGKSPRSDGKPRHDGKPRFDRKPDGQQSGDRPRFERKPDGQQGDRPRFDRKPDAPRSGDRPRFERKPDGQQGERPRFDRKPDAPRSGDRPRFDRKPDAPHSGDRPRFERKPDGQQGDRPRFDRKPGGQPSGDRPRFDRKPGGQQSGDRPRFERKPDGQHSGDRPRFDRKPDAPRSGDRPRFERKPDGQQGERPRFERKPDGQQGDRPRFERKPDGQQSGDRPRFDRKPDAPRSGDRPRFERKPDGQQGDRPRFERKPDGQQSGDRPRFDRKPDAPRTGDRPRFDRKPDAPRSGDRPRFERKPDGQQGDRPRFDRKPDGQQGDRPRFERKPDGQQSDRPRYDRKPSSPRPAPAPKPRGDAGVRVRAQRSQATVARIVALDALLDVARSGAFASLALDQRIQQSSLSDLDKRFATEIFYGTIERRLYLDWALRLVMDAVPDEPVSREVLRMTAYQMIFMDRVPPVAACSQAAELMREKKNDGLIPAVFGALKNLARRNEEGLPEVEGSVEEELSLITSTPLWLVNALIEAHGFDTAKAFLRYKPLRGYTTVHTNPMLVRPDEHEDALFRTGLEYREGQLPGCYYLKGDAIRNPAFFEGLITAQSEASQLCAIMVGVQRGQRILDACAAPGGKTVYMAAQMQGTGRVVAWDVHPHRVQLIAQTAARLKLENVRQAIHDAAIVKRELIETMDAVLVDAPCSGVGVLHEKPDLRYRLSEQDVTELAAKQMDILDACCQYVKPGGVLVYATCTTLPQENRDVAKAFLAKHSQFSADWTGLPENLKPYATDEGLQLWPHRDGMEGFFLLRMKRTR